MSSDKKPGVVDPNTHELLKRFAARNVERNKAQAAKVPVAVQVNDTDALRAIDAHQKLAARARAYTREEAWRLVHAIAKGEAKCDDPVALGRLMHTVEAAQSGVRQLSPEQLDEMVLEFVGICVIDELPKKFKSKPKRVKTHYERRKRYKTFGKNKGKK